jgi:hypothetical protein
MAGCCGGVKGFSLPTVLSGGVPDNNASSRKDRTRRAALIRIPEYSAIPGFPAPLFLSFFFLLTIFSVIFSFSLI